MTKPYKKVSWLQGTNLYEVNIRQYTPEGSFTAFSRHIPRLQDMGVKILWLMPITPISMQMRQGTLGSYYACNSYTDINPEFGDLDDFKNLVNITHQNGMKLIIDWVANHTGYDHHWALKYPEWYVKDENGNFVERNGWMDVIDLNYESTEMRNAMIEAMKFWIRECDIDGFRCDMAHLVPLDFWHDARSSCDELKKLFWLAECDVMEYHEVFDASYAWEWMHISEKLAKQIAGIQHMKDVLDKYAAYPPDAQKLYFTSNHDENSWNGTEYEKYNGGVKAFAVFCCMWPGIPLVYSGQELPNYKRLLFFDKDCINWQSKISLHQFYQLLFSLRSNNKAVYDSAELHILQNGADDKVFSFLKTYEKYKLLVVINFSPHGRTHCVIEHKNLNGNYRNLFSGIQYHFNNSEKFELQEWEYFIYTSV